MSERVKKVVRAERFELVDRSGRVRAVLGTNTVAPSEYLGLTIYDERGSARAWLIDEVGVGTQLVLALKGNQLVVLETKDLGDHRDGAAISMGDLGGLTVVKWAVSGDGVMTTTNYQRFKPLEEEEWLTVT